jgi:hypothetical protein
LIVDKIWNLTNEVHLTLTEWKPIPHIYSMRTTVGRQSWDHRKLENLGGKSLKKRKKPEKTLFFFEKGNNSGGRLCVTILMPTKRGKGSVVECETGKKAKTTPHTGGKYVSEKW